MYYTLYKITNTITNRIYIGVHQTDNLNDGYMGSGVLLKRSQQKHGIVNFKKEILEVFDSCNQMMEAESIIVNDDFVKSNTTYNLVPGGGRTDNPKDNNYYQSGNHIINVKKAGAAAVKQNKKLKQDRIDLYLTDPTVCKHCSEPLPYDKKRNKFCNTSCAASFNNTGRVPSKEHRQKVSEFMKLKNTISV